MKNGEKGYALPVALVLVAFGGLVIAPFLGHAGTGMIGSPLYGEAISAQYAADAGVEHAIWDLTYDDLADQVPSPGDSTSYQLGEAINGIAANITVCKGWEVIASDDFESGGWTGGNGWLDDWSPSGTSSVTTSGVPYEGTYHLLLSSNDGYARRSVDLSIVPSARLQFWAKVNSFEGGEEAYCYISPDGIDWTQVYYWDNTYDDNTYYPFDIDLSAYDLSSNFWIAFSANMSAANDYFYVDDLEVIWDFDSTAPIATDNFESISWSGGTGWLYDWYYEGSASITSNGGAYEGSFHLRLTGSSGYVHRAVDLSGLSNASIQLWGRADFDSGEEAYCLISANGTDWTTAHTWDFSDADDTYHFCYIDLSPYELSSEFWIAFDANMGNVQDRFYVDDLKVCGASLYGITSVADDETIRAVVGIDGVTVNVLWWRVI